MQIHYQLATLKKGNSSIVGYFHQFTTLVDTLAATVHALKDFEITSFLLAGLGFEYDFFVTSVTTRVDPLTIDELNGHLLAHELWLEHQQTIVDLQLVEQILQQDMETPAVVVAAAVLFNLAVALPLVIKKLLEAMGVEMVLKQTVLCVKFATNLVIWL